jgi:hypothetical protein
MTTEICRGKDTAMALTTGFEGRFPPQHRMEQRAIRAAFRYIRGHVP